jgi:limonene-1,2-epoxide hydrolase
MDESKINIVTACLEAFGRKDIDGAMSHIAPDIEWHYHVGTRPVAGRENMRKVLTKLGQHQLDSRWRAIRWAEVGDTLMIEGVEDYLTAEDRRAQVPYMGAYDFDADNLIIAWRDYFDLDLLMKSERGEPMEVWVQSLVDAEPE